MTVIKQNVSQFPVTDFYDDSSSEFRGDEPMGLEITSSQRGVPAGVDLPEFVKDIEALKQAMGVRFPGRPYKIAFVSKVKFMRDDEWEKIETFIIIPQEVTHDC